MTLDQVLARLKRLKEPLCDEALIIELYGRDVLDPLVFAAWQSWSVRGMNKPRPTQVKGLWHRSSLETFFQQERVLPAKWAAARLGMTLESFGEVLVHLRDGGRVPLWTIAGPLISERFVREFPQLFPDLRATLFGSHDSMCLAVHKALEAEGVSKIQVLRDVTAPLLGHDDVAYEFDAISDEPIGLRFQLWLNTGKAMNLRPDACSWKLFVEHRPQLEKWLFPGETGEDVPRVLAPGAA